MTIAINHVAQKALFRPTHQLQLTEQRPPQPPQDKLTESSLTELVFTRHSCDSSLLLLPMLSHLSKISDRWLTWFTATRLESLPLHEYSVNTAKIRVIHTREKDDIRWMYWEALNNQTSHTVIASFDRLNREDIQHFEEAAQHGQSKGLIIRYR